jgi:hypothetical protein
MYGADGICVAASKSSFATRGSGVASCSERWRFEGPGWFVATSNQYVVPACRFALSDAKNVLLVLSFDAISFRAPRLP